MHHHQGVSTLEILIRDLQAKINNPNYDSLYIKRLEDFLENKIKKGIWKYICNSCKSSC